MRNSKKDIVKVQISLATNAGRPQVLVYDKDRSNIFEGDAPKEILREMKGSPKEFFYALIPEQKGYITLLNKAPWQDW